MEKEPLIVRCPVCNGETGVKVFEDTVLLNFPLTCPCCRRETIINVVKLKLVPSEPTT